MRKLLTTIMCVAVSLYCFAAMAASSPDTKITLNCIEQSAEQVLKEIEKQSGLNIVYKSETARKWPKITLKVSGQAASEAIKQVAAKIGEPYSINNNIVTIGRETPVRLSRTITGNVKDNEGEPLTGAIINVKGSGAATGTGTVTDIDGNFSIKVNSDNPVLTVQYVGMTPFSMELTEANTSRPIDVTLSPNATMMSEVIVTGYQTLSKERASGSFTVVTPEKLQGKLQTGIMARLEGMVAGMKTVNGGTPEIRGVSTISGTKTPLYVVDGIPYEGDLAAINPADIVNVTVLKDATAASIYGARSANGVIVITTRSGEEGRTKVSYNGSMKFTPLPDRDYLNLTTSAELVDLQETLFKYPHSAYNPLTANTPMNEVYEILYDYDAGRITESEYNERMNHYRGLNNYDQFKDRYVRSNQMVQQHNISFSGGSGIYKYALSANYQKNYPYEKAQSDDRIGFNLKNQFDFFKWMRVNLGLIQSNTKADYDNGFTGYSYLYSGASYKMLYNEDGTPAQWYSGKNQREIDRLNSLGLLDETFIPVNDDEKKHYYSQSKYQNINLNVRFNIIQGLNLDLMYQNESTNSYSKNYSKMESREVKSEINNATVISPDGTVTNHIPKGGKLKETWTRKNSYTMRAQLNFNRQFADIHDVQAIAGAERRKVTSDGTVLNKWGYDDTTLAFKYINELNLGQAVNGTESTSGNYYYSGPYDSFSSSENRFVSFYANASYTYNNLITATGSIRVDKSNLFGTDPKWQNKPLWSAGLQYHALKNWNWVNRLSLRATYGINGNVAKNSGPFMIAQTSSRPNSFTNDFYSYITTPPNPALRWEKTKVINLGVDFSVLNSRINGSIEYYSKNTDDLLGNRQTDPTSGWGSLLLNYGSMYNRGVEVTLNSINYTNRDFEWTSSLVFSYNKNKLTNIENSGTSAIDYFYSPQNREGKPMSSLYSIRYAGLDSNGFPTAYKKDGTVVSSYRDLEADDLVWSGTTNPPYSAALTNRLTWRGFNLEFMFVYYGGHKLRDVAASYVWNRMPTLNYTGILDRDRMHFWQNPGDENDPDMAPAFIYGTGNTNSEYLWSAADKHIEKGDYIKLRNLIVGYSFPRQWISKAYLQGLRVDLQIQNLWYWAANKNNLDPEVWTGTSLTPSRGYHVPPTYTIGISANF